MASRHLAWLAVSGIVTLLAPCSNKTTSEGADSTPPLDHVDYVRLLDDDDDPDQVEADAREVTDMVKSVRFVKSQ